MRIVSHPEASEELEAAAIWYEERHVGLGEAFLDEFEAVVRVIASDPLRWRKIYGENRKVNLGRFPYAVVFSLNPNVIHIKAVMHLHRRPFYWRDRV